MTTGIWCWADPRCEGPPPAETGLCHRRIKHAANASATIHKLSQALQVNPAWSGEPGRSWNHD